MTSTPYRIDLVTMDGEPEPVTRAICHVDTVDGARIIIADLVGNDPGCYYAIFDSEAGVYLEGAN